MVLELDRGWLTGAAGRLASEEPDEVTTGVRRALEFAFPRDLDPHLASLGWAPRFVDYLYLSFTNSSYGVFSRTDAAGPVVKLTMMAQSVVSLVVVALVVARAIGLFK